MRIIIILILLNYVVIAKDDILFKGGCNLANVEVINHSDTILTIKSSDGRLVTFYNPKIISIEKNKIDLNKESTLSGCAWIDPIKETWEGNQSTQYKYEYPNLKLLPVSIISFGLSFKYLNDGFQFEGGHGHDIALGALFLIAGSISTYIALDRVQVKSTDNKIQISYNF